MMSMSYIRLPLPMMLLTSTLLQAEPVQPQGFTPPSSVVSTESMLQLLMGLLVVLALIGLFAWLFKRLGVYPANQSNLIKVIASAGVGQRERIVLAEINDTWLILGVAPGHVSLLHRIDKSEITVHPQMKGESQTDFAGKLRANLQQDHAQ